MNSVCGQCGFNNPPGMRFCGNCGARLQTDPLAPSSGAGQVSPTSAEFGTMMGADLAERLRRAGLDAAGQRRFVTVLFADISGFTALSERIDGEDLYNLVQDYIKVLASNVYKYEGVVDKITGDGLMALFGAPISHENNAERAVRAALDMQEELRVWSKRMAPELGVELLVRIGLHSGSVVVGGIGASDLILNYTAIGDTVNLAHRIEEAAPPGTVLISEAAYRQVRAIFDCQRISVLNPKGIAHPVIAYRVVGAKARPGPVRGIEGLRAPMIGRDQELTQLQESENDLIENRNSQFVLVTGDAGLGKSRLVAEFKAGLPDEDLRLLEGHSLAYRRVSYWLIRDALYSYLRLPATTPPVQVKAQLHKALHELMGPQAGEALPFIEFLMALPLTDPQAAERFEQMDAARLRQQIFLTIHDFFLQELRRRPVLVILEDLHWADEASLELLAFLMDVLRNEPIYFLAVSRGVQSGALEKAVIWAAQNLGGRFRHIALQSLSRDQSRQLLNLLLSIPNLPDRLREQILLRAAGVPFYLEEILRMLMDQGVLQNTNGRWQVATTIQTMQLGVPDTLQELILTRFDRLAPAQRKVLQVAAVIGKDFSLELLNAVLPEGDVDPLILIDTLIEREFILPQSGASETDFTFRHILMSDAIYGTLLRKERSALHGKVAETIERIYFDRLDDQVELLANHYRWSPHQDRAIKYLILAGQKAFRNNVNVQSRQHYESALELLYQVEHPPYQAFQVHAGLGDCLVFSGEYPEARGHYEWALQSLTDDLVQERSGLQRNIARTFERQGDYDRALEYLMSAEQTLAGTAVQYPVDHAQIWSDIAWIHFRRGAAAESETLLRRALALVEPTTAYEVIASISNRLGGIALNRGDWDQAVLFLRQSIAIREETRDTVNLATSLNNLGVLEIEMGHFDSALENLTRGLALKQRLGQPEGIGMALNNLGWLRILRGELDDARKILQDALNLGQQIGYSLLQHQATHTLVEMHLADHNWGAALNMLNDNLQAVESLGDVEQSIGCYRQLGMASLGAGNLEMASFWAQKAETLLDTTGNNPPRSIVMQRGEYLLFRGMLAIQSGELDMAELYLQRGMQIFQTQRSRLYQARVMHQIGLLELARGRLAPARERLAGGLDIFQGIGAKLDAGYVQDVLASIRSQDIAARDDILV